MLKHTAIMIAAMTIATPIHAQDARVDPDHIMTVLKDAGYPAEYFSDEADYRQILSKSGNYQFLVEMYDCVDGKACQTLEFYSNYPKASSLTKERLDAYPGPREGTRIALNRQGDAIIRQELDINGEGGLTDEQFVAHVKNWETMLSGFFAYLANPSEAATAADTPATAAEGGTSAPVQEGAADAI